MKSFNKQCLKDMLEKKAEKRTLLVMFAATHPLDATTGVVHRRNAILRNMVLELQFISDISSI